MAQVKEQIKTLEKELNKMEISNLSDTEFKTLVIRMLKEFSEDLNSMKRSSQALDGVAQWIECQPVNQRITDSNPSQLICLGCGPGP